MRERIRSSLLRGAAVALAVLLAGCVKPPSVTAPAPSSDGALDFTLPRLNGGKPYRLSADRGEVVLIDVWAAWCEPCLLSLPRQAALAKSLEPLGLRFVTIAIDEDERAVAKVVESLELTAPVLRDPSAAVAERVLNVRVMPTTVVIDRRGFVRKAIEGAEDDDRALEGLLKNLLESR